MTVVTTSNIINYTGTAAVSIYAYPFKIFLNTDLVITETIIATGVSTQLIIGTDYTVDGVGVAAGGNVTLVAGNLPATKTLSIERVLPLTQPFDLNENDNNPSASFENGFDKLTMIAQQLLQAINAKSVTATDYNGTISHGTDANKPGSPQIGDVYIVTDRAAIYLCISTGTWVEYAPRDLLDTDADTGFEVEKNADEDIIRGKVAGVEAYKLNADGILDLVKQSKCRVYRATTVQTIPNNAVTKMQFNGESDDNQNEFDSSEVTGAADATEASKLHDADGGFTAALVGATLWNTTDDTYTTISGFVDSGELDLTDDIMVDTENYVIFFSRFTAKKAGDYAIVVHHSTATPGIDKVWAALIYKNGALHTASYKIAPANNNEHFKAIDVAKLAANDYIEGWAYQQTGGAVSFDNGETQTFMAIHKLS